MTKAGGAWSRVHLFRFSPLLALGFALLISSCQVARAQELIPHNYSGSNNFCPIRWSTFQFGGITEACTKENVAADVNLYCCPVVKVWALAGIADYLNKGNPLPVAETNEQGALCARKLERELETRYGLSTNGFCGIDSNFFTNFACGSLVSLGQLSSLFRPSGLAALGSCSGTDTTSCLSCASIVTMVSYLFTQQPRGNNSIVSDDCTVLAGTFLLARNVSSSIGTLTSIMRACPAEASTYPVAITSSPLPGLMANTSSPEPVEAPLPAPPLAPPNGTMGAPPILGPGPPSRPPLIVIPMFPPPNSTAPSPSPSTLSPGNSTLSPSTSLNSTTPSSNPFIFPPISFARPPPMMGPTAGASSGRGRREGFPSLWACLALLGATSFLLRAGY